MGGESVGEKQAETEAKVGKPLEDRAAAKMSSPSSVDIGIIVVGEPFEWSWWWEIRAGDDDNDEVEDLGETDDSMGVATTEAAAAAAAALKSS